MTSVRPARRVFVEKCASNSGCRLHAAVGSHQLEALWGAERQFQPPDPQRAVDGGLEPGVYGVTVTVTVAVDVAGVDALSRIVTVA